MPTSNSPQFLLPLSLLSAGLYRFAPIFLIARGKMFEGQKGFWCIALVNGPPPRRPFVPAQTYYSIDLRLLNTYIGPDKSLYYLHPKPRCSSF